MTTEDTWSCRAELPDVTGLYSCRAVLAVAGATL